jgi:hypothetical protein
MALPGNYTLFYDWTNSGSYSSTSMTLAAGGTFTLPAQGYNGTWVAENGMLIFQFSNSHVTYAGNVVPNVVTGLMSTFAGLNGGFYLLETSTHSAHGDSKHAKATADSSGKKY